VSDYIERLEEIVGARGELGQPIPFVTVRTQDLRSLLSDVERMRGALEKIAAVENEYYGGDWDAEEGE
jgi:hypothetical protein